MNDFPPGTAHEPAGRRIVTIGGVPIFVGPGILFTMAFGAVPKLWHGAAVTLFTAAAVFVAILAHEAAHAVVARRRGLRVELISIGSGAFCYCGHVSAGQLGVSVFAAGSLVNLALAAALAALSTAFAPDSVSKEFVDAAMQVNLLFGISNLMPAYGVDGGYIACLLLDKILPWRAVLAIVGAVGLLIEVLSIVILVGLVVAGWPLTWSVGVSNRELLRWAWHEPSLPQAKTEPRPPRPVPSWLVRHAPNSATKVTASEAGTPD